MSQTAVGPRSGMDERFRARRRAVARQRVRRRRRGALSVALLAVLAAGSFVIARSPLFAVTDVRINGVRDERVGLVQRAAAIREGQSLLGADLAGAARRVGRLAWVRDVDVRRDPPSAVVIEVVPRRPAAVVEIVGATWTVDATGVVMAGGRRPGLPVVTAPRAALPGPGKRVADTAVRNALEVRASLPPSLRRSVRRYDAASARGLRILVVTPEAVAVGGRDGVWVRFGLAERVAAKARVIEALLDQARRRAASADQASPAVAEVDVRVPNNPVILPVDATGG